MLIKKIFYANFIGKFPTWFSKWTFKFLLINSLNFKYNVGKILKQVQNDRNFYILKSGKSPISSSLNFDNQFTSDRRNLLVLGIYAKLSIIIRLSKWTLNSSSNHSFPSNSTKSPSKKSKKIRKRWDSNPWCRLLHITP